MKVALLENKLAFTVNRVSHEFLIFFFSLLNCRCNPEKCGVPVIVTKVNRSYTIPNKNKPFLLVSGVSVTASLCMT